MLRRLTDPLGKCLTQDEELALGPNSLYYDLTGGIQVACVKRIIQRRIDRNVHFVLALVLCLVVDFRTIFNLTGKAHE